MLAIQILAPLMMAISIIYILSCLIILVKSLWENNEDNITLALGVLFLPIVSFTFMILFYIYYM